MNGELVIINPPLRKLRLLAPIIALFPALSAVAQLPFSKTQVAGPVRATTATLNGMGVARGNLTTAWFEWGTDRTYGNTTTPQDIGSGTHVVRVTAPLTGLLEGGVYHYRLVLSNSVGVAPGFDSMFTTSMKVQNWGSFSYGLPAIPPGLTNLSGMASGHGHCLAVHNDGTVAAWMVGFIYPNYGQTNIPPGLSNVVAVAGGYSHCLALKEDGTVVAWGKYSDGTSPAPPANLTNVIAIAGGDYFSAALLSNGTVRAWGRNVYGNETNVPPTAVDITAISCGSGHTLALKADGTVVTWGLDGGTGPAPSSAVNVVAVATMGYWNLALKADGTVVPWGSSYAADVPMPANLTNVVAIVTGYAYAEVLTADGTLVGWGRGQDTTNIPPQLSNVVAFASGDYHRVGLAPVNLPPKPFPRSVSGGTNKPLIIRLTTAFFDPNGDPLSFQVSSLPALGTLYQYTDTGPGALISTPGAPVQDPSRIIFVPQADAYGNPYDSFSVTANDGEFQSGPALWTVAIVPSPLIQTASIAQGPPPAFLLAFAGLTNTSYSVWGSPDLSSWSYLGAPTQTSPGQFTFSDSTMTNSPTRFYRIRCP